ncbi:MAG: dethiobiotin synthase [Planctomycetes bacterium]|nr:dethiobiotin synthase [Planctomycetota bacterium]
MAGFFITGTDTGVGKTRFASLLAQSLISKGADVKVCKPVATGGKRNSKGVLVGEDTLALSRAAADKDLASITPWCFEVPASPALAAKLEGSNLSVETLAVAVEKRCGDAFAIVEGAGGLLCPLTDSESIADLALRLKYPIIIVARRSLGTLNHLLLTLEVARHYGLVVAGVVMSETEEVLDQAAIHNPVEFSLRSSIPLLAVLPFEKKAGKAGREAVDSVDWLELSAGIQEKLALPLDKIRLHLYEEVKG